MKARFFSAVFVVMFFSGSYVFAEESGDMYMGLSLGRASINAPPDVGASAYGSSSSFKYLLSGRIGYIGVELAYLESGKMEHACDCDTYVEFDGLELSLLGYVPINRRLNMNIKGGVVSWNLNSVVHGEKLASISGDDITYGFGMTYDMYERLSVRGLYEIFQGESDIEVTNFSVAILLKM
ncbi:MAG: outer membrane beta-barrel protein [Pseudomonadota bacterium]